MTRSELFSPDRATTAGSWTGVDAAPADAARDGAAVAELVRCELARLSALLRRHFSPDGEDSLLPALADTSGPAAAATARAFLDQIRNLASALQRDAGDWSASPSVTGAFADFRRETMAVLRGVEDRIEGRELHEPLAGGDKGAFPS